MQGILDETGPLINNTTIKQTNSQSMCKEFAEHIQQDQLLSGSVYWLDHPKKVFQKNNV